MNIKLYYYISVFLILFSVNYINAQLPDEYLSLNYSVKTLTLVGTQISLASGEITFDQDLYIKKHSSCPNFVCSGYNFTCPPCDYTHSNPLGCGNRPAGCEPCSNYTEFMFANNPCETSYWDWDDLQINQPFHKVTKGIGAKATEFSLFRYYPNSTCQGYKISLNYYKGVGIVSADFVPFQPVYDGVFKSVFSHEIDPSITFCPSLTGFRHQTFEYYQEYPYGTIFIAVINENLLDFEYDITIEPIEVDSDPITPCTQVDPDFECVSDGQLVTNMSLVEVGTFVKYSFTFTGCQDITIVTNFLLNDIDLFVGDSPNVSSTNFKWSSTYSIDENLLIYLCPDQGESSKTIYFGILPFYTTNYEFFVKTNPQIEMVDIAEGPVINGQYRLYTTSYILNSKSGKQLRCDNYDRECYEYFPTYPREELQALYPIPGIFNADGFFSPRYQEIYISQSDNKGKHRSYQFGIILSLMVDNVLYSYNLEEDLENMEMHFLNRLFTKNGKPITGVIPLKGHQNMDACSYEEFKNVLEEMNNIVEELDRVDYNQINGLRYEIDILTYDDRYYSCKAMAESFLNFTTITKNINTKMCVPTSNISQYWEDPCCSIYARYDKCCATREKEVTFKTLSNVYEDKVDDQCAFSNCAISVLTDFADSLVGNQYDPCKVTAEDEDTLERNLYDTFRTCKKYYSYVYCTTDQTCIDSYNSSDAKCSLRKQICDVPHNVIDKIYVECIIRDILPSLRHEVLSKFKISTSIPTIQAAELLYPYLLSNDCTTEYNFDNDIRYMLTYTMDSQAEPYCFPYSQGLDKSMEQKYSDSCYLGIYSPIWIAQEFTEAFCSEIIRCDWLGLAGNHLNFYYDELVEECFDFPTSVINNGYNFCGDCSDPLLDCVTDLTISNQQTCTSKYVCYLADVVQDSNYVPIYVNSEQECTQNYGSCSVPCDYECGGTFCIIERNDTQNVCPEIARDVFGKAMEDPENGYGKYCSYAGASSTLCSSKGGTLVNCNQFTKDQCTLCNNADPNIGCSSFGGFCTLQPIQCTTQAECEAVGECSDSMYFKKQFGTYPTYKPKCLYGRSYETSKNSSQPNCQIPYTQDSPLGCFEVWESSLIDQTICEDWGGVQWTQSTTKEECENFASYCSGTENFPSDDYLPYTRRYNYKNEQDCNCAGQDWGPPFYWTPAFWTPASPVQLQWLPINSSNPITQIGFYKPVLSHATLFNEFSNAKFKRSSLLYKSEILCRVSAVKNSLESLSCSCTTDGGSSCFDIVNPPVISVVKPCFATLDEFSILSNEGSLVFNEESIATGSCVSISIAEVSPLTFLSKKIVALSSGFVSYKIPGDYSVYNDKKAVIGEILSSGIQMDFFDNGTNFFELCLTDTIETGSSYPVLDIGFITDENEGIVEPIECDLVVKNGKYCCTKITRVEKVSKYILIKRIDNWKEEPYQPFSKSARNMLYTLAVIFLVLAIYGLGNLGFFLFLKLFATESFKLVHLLFLFLTLFGVIRSIYFFILPSGTILDQSANVGEYILVVLPTFLYFTSFTIVVVIWYTLTSSSFNSDIYKRMFKLIIGINVILYVLFIAIVLVFNFTKQKTPPTCGGRILAEYSNSSPQKVVSILYAVLQSVLSLAIGLAFIYYGRKIYLKLSEIKRDQTIIQKKRVLYIGVICSTGFVLHCIFIIILVSANPSNVIFSFIGLIITEIIPVSTLFFFNNQFPWYKVKERAFKQLSLNRSSTQSTHSEKTINTADSSISMSSRNPYADKKSVSINKVEPITILR